MLWLGLELGDTGCPLVLIRDLQKSLLPGHAIEKPGRERVRPCTNGEVVSMSRFVIEY